MQQIHGTPNDEATVMDVFRFVVRNSDLIEIGRVRRVLNQFARNYGFSEDDVTSLNRLQGSAMLTEVAKANPTFAMIVVQQVAKAKKEGPETIRLLTIKQKVPAIKLIRANYSLGLKEAKDIADRLQDELFIRGKASEPYNFNGTFDGFSLYAIEQLMEFVEDERNAPDAVDERQPA